MDVAPTVRTRGDVRFQLYLTVLIQTSVEENIFPHCKAPPFTTSDAHMQEVQASCSMGRLQIAQES